MMRNGTNTRCSAELFFAPKDDVMYAPEEVVDDEHPRLFKPIDYEAYFQFSTEGTGRRDLSALRTYGAL